MAAVISNDTVSAVTDTGFTLTLTSDVADEPLWAACRTSGPYGAGDAEQIKTDSVAAPTAGIPWGGTITSTADANNVFTVTGLQTSQTTYYGVAQEGEVVVTNLHVNPTLSGGDAVDKPPTAMTVSLTGTSEWPTPTDLGGGNYEWLLNGAAASARVSLQYQLSANNANLPEGVYDYSWDARNTGAGGASPYQFNLISGTNATFVYGAYHGLRYGAARTHAARFVVTGPNAAGLASIGTSFAGNSTTNLAVSNPAITHVEDPAAFPNPLFEGQIAGDSFPTYWYSDTSDFDHVVSNGEMTINGNPASDGRFQVNFSLRDLTTLEVGKLYRILIEAMIPTTGLGTWNNINIIGSGHVNFSVGVSVAAAAGEWGELYMEFGITSLTHTAGLQIGPGTNSSTTATYSYRNPRLVDVTP